MSILLRGLIAARYPLSSIFLSLILPNLALAGPDAERIPVPQVHEEMWAIPSSPVPIAQGPGTGGWQGHSKIGRRRDGRDMTTRVDGRD